MHSALIEVKRKTGIFSAPYPDLLRSVKQRWTGEFSRRYISGIDILLSYLNTRSGYTTDMEYLMKITEPANVESDPHPHHVDVRRIYESPHAMAVVIPLKPGESLKKHITPVDVFFFVLEGSGVGEIADEKQTVGKGTLVEGPARIPHLWSNESSIQFRALVETVPKPTEETRMLRSRKKTG